MSEPLACYIDGRPADSVPVQDRGLQYGDGVFTTVAIKAGTPLLWERHLQRLQRDTARLGIAPIAPEVLQDEIERVCRGVARATLKIFITRGAGSRGYRPPAEGSMRRIVTLWPRAPQAANASDGIAVRLCRARLSRNPLLAGIKHLNRLEQVLARAEWGDDYAEGLMQDTTGMIIEGTMTNVFLVREGELLTPDLSQCGVAGVMREEVLERAHAANIPSRVSEMPLTVVQAADEIFVTNSLIGIWPIRHFETKEYRIGPITRTLQAAIVGAHDGV